MLATMRSLASVALLVLLAAAASAFAVDTAARTLEEDAYLSCPELITKYGYPVEQHEVTTEDGYILTIFRIPYGKTSTTKAPNPKPVYLQHGLLSSSDDWIITRPDKGLGYILADAGYDVWLTNIRGNKWGRQHVSLSPKKSKFWDFSWHEMGVYDLPATIDYILGVAGVEQLHYIGHSMGTTMFYVMGAMRPEYNAKIRGAFTLAPVAYMGNTKTPFFQTLAKNGDKLGVLLKLMGINEFLPHHELFGVMGDKFCNDEAVTQAICANALFLICGWDSEELNRTMIPLIASHDPSGSSVKNLLHYAQNIKTGKFQLYDYGTIQNLVKYGSRKAPSYDLSKITAPVALHYGENDIMAVPDDVQKLQRELPNLIGKFKVPFDKFNHLDFLFAIHAKEYVYDFLVSLMDSF